jgi:hypothetical protein
MNLLQEATEELDALGKAVARDDFSWASRHAVKVIYDCLSKIVAYLIINEMKSRGADSDIPAAIKNVRAAE